MVKEWDGVPGLSPIPFAEATRPLVGFSIIEAESIDEGVGLVADTPCARAEARSRFDRSWVDPRRVRGGSV